MVDERASVDAAGDSGDERGGVPGSGRECDGRYQLAADGTVVAADDGLCRLTGYSRGEIVDEHVSLLLGPAGSQRYEGALGTVRQQGSLGATEIAVTLATAGGDRVPCSVRVQALDGDPETWTSLGELQSRRAADPDGATVDRSGFSRPDPIRQLGRELGTIETHAALAERVCALLSADPAYGAVWAGRSRCSDTVLEPEATAGVGDVSLRTDDGGPVGRALETGTVQTGGTEDLPDALAETGTTVAAVPFVDGGAVYGLLVVTTDEASAVEPPRRAALADLGALLGHVICCLRGRQTLMTGRVTEVTLRVQDGGSVLSALAERLDCCVTVEGVVSTPDGRPRHYVTVHCGATDRVRAVAADWPGVERFEIVSEHDDACVVAVEPPEPTLHRVTADHGGSVRDLVFERGGATVTVELPEADGTRELLAALRATFDTVRLAAQRETDRSIQTRRQFRTALLDRLSDRQQTALRLAYHAGYFEWPRESTGEDIAASMNVSAPTFHKHLRHAEAKLAGAVVGTEEGC
jgi:PAS domain-containing protein